MISFAFVGTQTWESKRKWQRDKRVSSYLWRTIWKRSSCKRLFIRITQTKCDVLARTWSPTRGELQNRQEERCELQEFPEPPLHIVRLATSVLLVTQNRTVVKSLKYFSKNRHFNYTNKSSNTGHNPEPVHSTSHPVTHRGSTNLLNNSNYNSLR